MGYSAFVNCNCYKEKKIKERLPFEEFIVEGEEGLELNLDWENHKDEHIIFSRWKDSKACEHAEMEYCYEGLANVSGMDAFRTICLELGKDEFPILNKYLPTSNDGYLPSIHAEEVIEELNKMKALKTRENIIVLKEMNRDEIIYSTNSNYERIFYLGGDSNYNCGIGKIGFFVVKKRNLLGFKTERKIWTTKSFKQRKNSNGKFYFEDTKTKKKLNININLVPLEKNNNDSFDFEVLEKQATIMDNYSYIIEPLLRLAKASTETGNKIIWT